MLLDVLLLLCHMLRVRFLTFHPCRPMRQRDAGKFYVNCVKNVHQAKKGLTFFFYLADPAAPTPLKYAIDSATYA